MLPTRPDSRSLSVGSCQPAIGPPGAAPMQTRVSWASCVDKQTVDTFCDFCFLTGILQGMPATSDALPLSFTPLA